ncbi:MAG TPA: hypothetical protein VHI52_19900, partial [Verrucomicrobiae bacterium]|nr:hypothetical protein [Verrucomicrobiae bacterium]
TSDLAREVWLFLEGIRFDRTFSSISDYALSEYRKCDPAPAWRNCLLNLRTFGLKAGLFTNLTGYPRERLFHSLPLLLWDAESVSDQSITRHLQRQLGTPATDWAGLVNSYLRIWQRYG